MMKIASTILAVLLVTNVTNAEDSQMTPLNKDQSAPYSGVLLTPRAVADIIADIATKHDEQKAAIERAVGEEQAQCSYSKNEIKIRLEAENTVAKAHLDGERDRNKLLSAALKKAEDRQSNPMVWTGLGVLVGVGTTVLVVWALGQK